MGIFGKIGDVVSGRVAHKNATNNLVIRELWDRAGALPPFHVKLLQSFVVAASVVAEDLFYADDRLGSLDPKKFNAGQFRQFYDALLAFYYHGYCLSNPQFREALHDPLLRVCNDPLGTEALLKSLQAHQVLDHRAAGDVWSYLIKKVGIGVAEFEPFTRFTTLAVATQGIQGHDAILS